jgi:phosphate transport system protein
VSELDKRIPQLFALVTEALAGATEALLGGETRVGRAVVDADHKIDEITSELERAVWEEIDASPVSGAPLRHLVGLLLILPELERSADLAEHIAQRAVNNLGASMSPTSRGIVQQMSDVALQMWSVAADSFTEGVSRAEELALADDEIDALRDRLIEESKRDSMANETASQVAMLARFYERLGDHAVNLGRRIASIPSLRLSFEK